MDTSSLQTLGRDRLGGQVWTGTAYLAVVLDASLVAIAAGVHGTLTPAHALEARALGLGFAAATAFQLICAFLLILRPGRGMLRVAAFGNGALIVAWGISRVAGLPFGEGAWVPEPVGLLDLMTVGIELVAVWLSASLATGRLDLSARSAATTLRTTLAFVGGLGAIAMFTAQAHAVPDGELVDEGAHLLHLGLLAGAAALVFGTRWVLTRNVPSEGGHVTTPRESG